MGDEGGDHGPALLSVRALSGRQAVGSVPEVMAVGRAGIPPESEGLGAVVSAAEAGEVASPALSVPRLGTQPPPVTRRHPGTTSSARATPAPCISRSPDTGPIPT